MNKYHPPAAIAMSKAAIPNRARAIGVTGTAGLGGVEALAERSRRPQERNPHRPRDVLQRPLAEIDELGLDPAAHMIERRPRNANSSRLCDAFQPRRDIDPVAQHVLAVDQHVAEMNANSVDDAFRLGSLRVALGRLFLHGEAPRWTAATTEANSISIPSPIVLKTRPPCAATIGAAASRRSRTIFAVPASSSPMSLE